MLLQCKFTTEACSIAKLTSLLKSAQLANAPTVPVPSTLAQTLGHAAALVAVERAAPVSVRVSLMAQGFVSMGKRLVRGLPVAGTVQIVGWAVYALWGLVVGEMFASPQMSVVERIPQNC
jgi:hypothetical protein